MLWENADTTNIISFPNRNNNKIISIVVEAKHVKYDEVSAQSSKKQDESQRRRQFAII